MVLCSHIPWSPWPLWSYIPVSIRSQNPWPLAQNFHDPKLLNPPINRVLMLKSVVCFITMFQCNVEPFLIRKHTTKNLQGIPKKDNWKTLRGPKFCGSWLRWLLVPLTSMFSGYYVARFLWLLSPIFPETQGFFLRFTRSSFPFPASMF